MTDPKVEEMLGTTAFQPPVAKGFRVQTDHGGQMNLVGTVNFGEIRERLSMNLIFSFIYDVTEVDEDRDYHLVGVIAGKRTALSTDQTIHKFFFSCQSPFPNIELHSSPKKKRAAEALEVERRKLNRMEALETENASLLNGLASLEDRVQTLETNQVRDSEEFRALVSNIEKNTQITAQQYEEQVAEINESITEKISSMSRALESSVARAERFVVEAGESLAVMNDRINTTETQISKELSSLQEFVSKKETQFAAIQAKVDEVKIEAEKSSKSFASLQKSKADSTEVKERTTELRELLSKMATNLSNANESRTQEHDTLLAKIDSEINRVEAGIVRLDTRTRINLMNLEKRRKATTDQMDIAFQTGLEEVREITERLMQEKADVNDLDDLHADLLTDIKASQDAIAVVSKKYDIAKDEFDQFTKAFQNRVRIFEEEVGKKLVQQKLNYQLELQKSEEGYLASTKMLSILQRELGDFIEQNGRHVSILQHDHQGIKEGIILLDHEKTNIQRNLRNFADEYQLYLDESDAWSVEVNRKIANLVQALEPTQVEWRIENMQRKLKNADNEPAIRSDKFSLNSVANMRMDFYPAGINNRVYQDGVACVRFYAPKGSNFKYEISIGRVCDGTKIFDTSNMISGIADGADAAASGGAGDLKMEGGFWIDLMFPEWQVEITNDSVVITCDIVDNLNSIASTQKVCKLSTP